MLHSGSLQGVRELLADQELRESPGSWTRAPPPYLFAYQRICGFVSFQCKLPGLLVGHGGGGRGPGSSGSFGGSWSSRGIWRCMCDRIRLNRSVIPGASVPPGFDLPAQPGGAPAAGVPGNSWPEGRVKAGDRVTPARGWAAPPTRAQALPHSCRVNIAYRQVLLSPHRGEIPWGQHSLENF